MEGEDKEDRIILTRRGAFASFFSSTVMAVYHTPPFRHSGSPCHRQSSRQFENLIMALAHQNLVTRLAERTFPRPNKHRRHLTLRPANWNLTTVDGRIQSADIIS